MGRTEQMTSTQREEDVSTAEVGVLLEQLHHASYGWALCCCGRDRVMAEDVLQTAYWKVIDGRARYGARSSFKTWLFAVIRKTAAE